MQKVDARQLERLRRNTTFNALSRDYAKAFDLDPAYTYAAMSLIDLHLQDGDVGEAPAVLDRATDMPRAFRLGNFARADLAEHYGKSLAARWHRWRVKMG